jgi:hypothetical protein
VQNKVCHKVLLLVTDEKIYLFLLENNTASHGLKTSRRKRKGCFQLMIWTKIRTDQSIFT